MGDFSIHGLKAARAIGREDYRGTIRHYERHVASNPGDHSTRHLIALCHVWLGDDAQAIEWGTRALAIEPDHVPTLELLTASYARQGDHDRAYRCACRVLQLPISPSPLIPAWVTWFFAPFRLIPRLRTVLDPARIQAAQNKFAAEHAEWRERAEQYKAWYEETLNGKLSKD